MFSSLAASQNKSFSENYQIHNYLSDRAKVWKHLLTKELTLYYTIPTFNDPKEPAFSSFPTVFSVLSRREIIILTKSILSSANPFNLDQAKILSFLAHLSTTCSGGAIVTGHRPSSVRPSVRLSVRPSVRPSVHLSVR